MSARAPIRWLLGGLALSAPAAAALGLYAQQARYRPPIQVLGPVATVTEAVSGVDFAARVDTGAAVTSLHCGPGDFLIDGADADPTLNVSKPARLRVHNCRGESVWIDTRVTDYVEVRSANGAEHRYRIRLPLRCRGVQRWAIVNLKDRSRMTYRLLLGRDFLAGRFLVDVSR
ncbi:MAG: RimK/LysX family protein [Planctomycetota bacterium]